MKGSQAGNGVGKLPAPTDFHGICFDCMQVGVADVEARCGIAYHDPDIRQLKALAVGRIELVSLDRCKNRAQVVRP
ncbi:hypothetical protein SDC9_178235 [bioreactor metagenome]|uniref:Uncharacterized protein n=1 Tax=bioreactor metagenome TaxID=1076179 RepID=A0A645H381_9ZZZZ